MPEIIEIRQEHAPGLFDSATGESLVVERVVDITDMAHDRERTLLLFTRAKRGRIVQIAHPYEGQVYLGATIHYFIDEPLGDCFDYVSRRHRISGRAFRRVLRKYAPQSSAL